MNAEMLYALTGAALVSLSLYVLVAIPHLLRKLLAFNILATGIFLMLTGLGQRGGEADPIPQALVLTGIVVSFASTALALTLMRRWFRSSGRITLDSGLHGAGKSPAQRERAENGQRHSPDKAHVENPAATAATSVQTTAPAHPSPADGSNGPTRDWSR